MIQDDKGLNDFIQGASVRELKIFNDNLDILSKKELNLIISAMTYASRDIINNITVNEIIK